MNGDDSVDKKLENETMAAFVQTLLQQIQQRFQTMSDSIIKKIDERGCRIDELEQAINDLKAEMDADKPPSLSVPSLPKDDSNSPKEP
ncbi:heat shock factor-binding protein isoform X2 [Gossypium raimondii]|uniref:heat shock factor-binding protein isoform X2 n=1 Tax=Gossypium raimondii TaxID=29730 RepID=UPI00063A9E2F|nr:heat shock factor-binding protein isoform X2 [Gossypium raimondii]